jgi:hypothetical protein
MGDAETTPAFKTIIPGPFEILKAEEYTCFVTNVRKMPCRPLSGSQLLTRADRKLRRYIKRNSEDWNMLVEYEQQLVQILTESLRLNKEYVDVDHVSDQSEEDGWISLNESGRRDLLEFNISSSFLRLCVHAMSRYYALTSFSVNNADNRVTIVDAGLENQANYVLPQLLFTEYLVQ